LRLWQFGNRPELVAHVTGNGFGKTLGRLGPPQGGTETGAAIAAVLADTPTRDVLLITDGQSYALDVQAAAQSGRRFTVVLVGEDALEAQVGHLAALTGGEIFLAADDAGAALRLAFAAMRSPHEAQSPITGVPIHTEARLGGTLVPMARSRRAGRASIVWLEESLPFLVQPLTAPAAVRLRGLAQRVDWSADPKRLRRGDLSGLPDEIRVALENAASQCPEVIALATKLGRPPVLIALALLASSAPDDRNAARIARAILANAGAEALAAARSAVGL
jgi:hypothetical protein